MAWVSAEELEGLLEAFRRHVESVERLEKAAEARLGPGGAEAIREVALALRVFGSRLEELVSLVREGRMLEAGVVACEVSRRSYELMEGSPGRPGHRGVNSLMSAARPILARIYYAASQLCSTSYELPAGRVDF